MPSASGSLVVATPIQVLGIRTLVLELAQQAFDVLRCLSSSRFADSLSLGLAIP